MSATLTYKDVQDRVIAIRFDESNRPEVKDSINACYERVWNAQRWDFRYISGLDMPNMAISAGAYAPTTVPTDFHEALYVYDDLGEPLEDISQRDWEFRYQPDIVSGARGRPEAFAVVNRRILLGPVPDRSYTFKLSYIRRLSIRAAGGSTAIGFLTADGDKPLWEDEHTQLLVPETLLYMTGLRGGDDYQAIKAERDELMASLLADHLPDHGGVLQFGMGYSF